MKSLNMSSSSVMEFRTILLPKDVSRSFVKSLLVEEAELNRWTLDRLQIRRDGKRVITLRRKIIERFSGIDPKPEPRI